MIADTSLWMACLDKRIVYDLSFSRHIIKLELVTYTVTFVTILLFALLAWDVIKWFEKNGKHEKRQG